jgi:hypothetical protein
MINSLILRQHCAPTATLIAHLGTLHTVVFFVWRGYVKLIHNKQLKRRSSCNMHPRPATDDQ